MSEVTSRKARLVLNDKTLVTVKLVGPWI